KPKISEPQQGERLQELRLAYGRKEEDCAATIGMSGRQWRRWEEGDGLSRDKYSIIGDVFGIPSKKIEAYLKGQAPDLLETVKAKRRLYAEKTKELLAYLKEHKNVDEYTFAASIDEEVENIRAWQEGQKIPSGKDLLNIAHVWDVPTSWWDQEGVPIEKVVGKGLGKDEKSPALPVTVVNLAPALVYIVDPVTKENTWVNGEVERFLGRSAEEIVATPPEEPSGLLDEKGGQRYFSALKELSTADNLTRRTVEYKVRNKEGRMRSFRADLTVTTNLYGDDDNPVRAVIGVAQDIT